MKRIFKMSFSILFASLLLFICSFNSLAAEYEISSGETIVVKMEKAKITYISFTPVISGEYAFTSVSKCDTLGILYDENMKELLFDDDSGETSNFYLTYDFEKGKKYIFGVYYYGEKIDYDMTLTLSVLSYKEEHTHIYNEYIIDEENCTDNGAKLYVCYCGNSYTLKTEPLEHTYVLKYKENPTCTQDGYSVYECSKCKNELKKVETKLGHNYSSDFTVDKTPTCTAKGSASRHCLRCGKKTDVTSLQRIEHILSDEYETVKEATCTAKGEIVKRCLLCKSVIEKQEIAKLGHSYESEYTVDKKSTLESKGEKSKHCKRCSARSDVIAVAKIKSVTLSQNEYVYDGKNKTVKITVKNTVGNTLVKGTDYTVSFGKKVKNIGLYTATVTFKGLYGGVEKINFTVLPKNVSSVSASQTKSTISLKWGKVKGNVKYRVYRKNNKTGKFSTVATTEKTSIKIKNLKSGTDYTFSVRAVKTVDEKTFKSQKGTQISVATKPKSVTLKLSSPESRNVKFKWKKTACDGYEIYKYNESENIFEKIKTVKGEDITEYTRKNFAKGKEYTFKIRTFKTSKNKTLYSAFSKEVKIKVK